MYLVGVSKYHRLYNIVCVDSPRSLARVPIKLVENENENVDDAVRRVRISRRLHAIPFGPRSYNYVACIV